MVSVSVAPPSALGDEARRIRLRTARRQATGLLGLVFLALIAVIVLTSGEGWSGYLTAALEAAMVGGLADWFAVTALFRHPLGVPVPHTAVIPERKDSFGETLGQFVQDNLLTKDVIVDRIRQVRPAQRTAAWLAQPENATRVAGHLVDAAVTVADLLRDDDVHRAIEEAVRSRIETTPLAPLAGRALGVITQDQRHQDLLDVTLRAADRFLRDHRGDLRTRFGDQSPWWLPGAVEDRVFDRLVDGVHRLIHEVAGDPDHELRHEFDARLRRFAHQLQVSSDLRERGEALKRELLTQPQLRKLAAAAWRDTKATLRAEADDPASPLRQRLAEALEAFGTRLGADPAVAARVDEAVEAAAGYVSDQFHTEIGSMVSTTIARWDGHEAASRLELLLGPDLQFIRINGTLIGGLAGLGIYAVAQVVGG
jgi:uncharacterized membrane-anchored protein YjiN (DUF445 family)